ARAVRQLDKPEPPFGLEPFDDGVYRRAGRRFETRLAKPRRGAKFTKMWVIAVVVEIAASGLTKIPVSDQVGFLSSRFTAQTGPRNPIVPKKRPARERINCDNDAGARRIR